MDDFKTYDFIIKKLRNYFSDMKGFVEVPTQSRVSILAACEDPSTVASYKIGGLDWPLPQTGQMWLEHELLKNPQIKGVFCVTTSYRDEKNPIPGRHDRVFPMFEFESPGNMDDLIILEKELLHFLGFQPPKLVSYEEACLKYGVDSIEAKQEEKLCQDNNGPIMLHSFPQRTSPFWNMKHQGNNLYNKIDVELNGMETIGSAERSCNTEEMRNNFMTISRREYKQALYDKFGENRVNSELDKYLSLQMFPRFGGGIGMTRLARAMKLEKLVN